MSCWLRRTPYEAGLILILIVALPFFICLLITYFLLLATRCSFLCLTNYGKNYADDATKTRSDYPFMGAVLYTDVGVDKYVAPGVIVGKRHMLTSGKLIKERNIEPSSIYVRVNSEYWSKDGTVLQAKGLSFNEKGTLAGIKFDEDLVGVEPVAVSENSLEVDISVTHYFWKHNENVPLKFRKRLVTIDSSVDVIKKNSTTGFYITEPAETTISKAETVCINYLGFPVLIGRTLVGINTGSECDVDESTVSYLIDDTSRSLKWINQLINDEAPEAYKYL